MDMTFTNKSAQALGEFAAQFNKNSFALSPAAPLSIPTLAPNASHNVSLPIGNHGHILKSNPLTRLQVAIKDNVGISYFDCDVPMHCLWHESSKLERGDYLKRWKDLPDTAETVTSLSGVCGSSDIVLEKLAVNNVASVAKRTVSGHELCYLSIKFINDVYVLIELTLKGSGVAQLAVKTGTPEIVVGVQQSIQQILASNDSDA